MVLFLGFVNSIGIGNIVGLNLVFLILFIYMVGDVMFMVGVL